MPSKIISNSVDSCLSEIPYLGVSLKSCKIFKNSCHLGRIPSDDADGDLTCQNILNESTNTSITSCDVGSDNGDGNEKELARDTTIFRKPAMQLDFHELDELAEVSLDTTESYSKTVSYTTAEYDEIYGFESAHCDKGHNGDRFVPRFESSENSNKGSDATGIYHMSSIDERRSNSSEIDIYSNNVPEQDALLQGGEEFEDTINITYAYLCKEVMANSEYPWLPPVPRSEVNHQKYDYESFLDSWTATTLNSDFFNELPSLLDLESTAWLMSLPEELSTGTPVTLVLDLDETLVHTTTSPCDGSDFSFELEERVLYVQKRPFLHAFLERVGELFQIIIFTAGTRNYADHVLDTLDPERRLTSWRAYRDSCIFSDNSYTKDLTVLGVDLAKLAIVDNTPAVFHELQVNNGIPIKSWFGDENDQELLSLLPFLEVLASADDVRPFIAEKFGEGQRSPRE
ncbi:unnamed protein product [Rhodiola kirilowii]